MYSDETKMLCQAKNVEVILIYFVYADPYTKNKYLMHFRYSSSIKQQSLCYCSFSRVYMCCNANVPDHLQLGSFIEG